MRHPFYCLAAILHAHMLQNFDKVLEQGLSLLVGDYSCCDVTKDMRAAGLNRIQIAGMKNKCINFANQLLSLTGYESFTAINLLLFVKEDLYDLILALRVVEVDK